MISFCIKIVYFLISYIIIVFLLFFSFKFIENNFLKNKTYNKVDYFILGNSHAAQSLNDTILSKTVHKSFINLACPAQSLFSTVLGAEKIIKHGNPSNIIFEFSNNSLTTDLWAYSNITLLKKNIDRMYVFDWTEWKHLLMHNASKTIKLFFTLPLPDEKIAAGDVIGIGNKGLKEDFRNNAKRIDFQYIFLNNHISKDNNYFMLENIIKKNQKIHFIIYRAPMHKMYFSILDKRSNENLYIELLNNLNKYPNCKVLDFGHMYFEDSFFYDLDHMNYQGAKLFSNFFADTLTKLNWQ